VNVPNLPLIASLLIKQVVTYVADENFGWYPSFKPKL
jgi:hypothetical protein